MSSVSQYVIHCITFLHVSAKQITKITMRLWSPEKDIDNMQPLMRHNMHKSEP